MTKQVHLFGVRHHGPGSARAVLRALDSVRPECVLIEGPPDAADVLGWAAHAEMKPPVALLIYQADDPKQAAFYPFAEFSPEWCAIRWSIQNQVPVRFMDLPQTHRIPLATTEHAGSDDDSDISGHGKNENSPSEDATNAVPQSVRTDPLNQLARAAGFDDGERWWEYAFELRRHSDTEIFTAIREAMVALREGPGVAAESLDREEPFREAWMRRTIRETQREFENVVAICGAWHVPALSDDAIKSLKKEDDATLKTLTKVKTVATWIPWTYDRLAAASGYRAGVHSPGWYEHLWSSNSNVLERWMVRIGTLLREQDIDCSSAHIIEAVRLATSLAAMRNRPLADLSDIADACRSVFCFDSDLAMRLIAKKLLIGERLGEVPEETPLVPLQQDLQRQQKRLRLKPEALEKTLDLDLRNETDLARSELLHQLKLLGVDWGTPLPSRGGKGTFHELWQLRWEPAFLVRLIELGAWGNTVQSAAAGYTLHLAEQASDLEQLTGLLGDVMLANLPTAVEALMNRILNMAAVAADVAKLMDAFPPLADVFRYGNVRQTDRSLVQQVILGILPRIFIGLGGAVSALNDEAAREMHQRIIRVDESLRLIEMPAELAEWFACLVKLADQASVHGLLRGRCTRLLFDQGQFTSDDVASRMSLTLSKGTDPAQAAAWVEGFLSSSGLVLLHHADLLNLIDQWVCSISTDVFNEQIPLLRRTFSTFPPAERRQIGERLRAGPGVEKTVETTAVDLNLSRARRVLPVLRVILGTN